MNPVEYLAEIQSQLVASAIVDSINIIAERVLPDNGYFRARLRLSNGDFLEIAEYFTYDGNDCYPRSYRFQWMNESQTQLRRRWDDVPHFPQMENAPHHAHIGDDETVISSQSVNTLDVLRIIERELTSR
jgi:hypothetical protein